MTTTHTTPPGDRSADEAAIIQVVDAYFESWFMGVPERMKAALHPQLAKRGVHPDGPDGIDADTAASMVGDTEQGYGTKYSPEQRSVAIRIDDIYGSIATVTVSSPIYHEYIHLVRDEAGWRILNTLWQPT